MKLRFLCLSFTDIRYFGYNNSLKIQVIHFKLVACKSIRLTLQVNIENMYLSLKNNILLSEELGISCLSPKEHDILGVIDDNSLKTLNILSAGRIR